MFFVVLISFSEVLCVIICISCCCDDYILLFPSEQGCMWCLRMSCMLFADRIWLSKIRKVLSKILIYALDNEILVILCLKCKLNCL